MTDTNSAANAASGGTAHAAGRDIRIDQSVHIGAEPAASPLPLVRTISPEDVPGFVGRRDELARLGRMLAPSAARGGPIVLSPVDDQLGVGLSALAIQAASRAAAAGWFAGGVLLVNAQAAGEARPSMFRLVLAGVLAELGERATGRGHDDQATYRHALAARADAGTPVLIVVDDVTDADADLIAGLAAGGPHRLLLTTREPLPGQSQSRTVPVDVLGDADAVDLLETALAVDHSGSLRPADPAGQLRVLAWRCGGVPAALRLAADELAARPETSVAELIQALATVHDESGTSPERVKFPHLAGIVALSAPRWAIPRSEPIAGKRFIGRRALLSWLIDDCRAGRSSRWDIVAAPGTGKSTLLDAARAELHAIGTATIHLSMDTPADGYERRRTSSADPLIIELARAQFCLDAVQLIARDLGDDERATLTQAIYRSEQEIQEALATRPAQRPDLDVQDLLIPRGHAGAPRLEAGLSAAYARQVAAVRADLGQTVHNVLIGVPGRLAALVDNLHLIRDAACRDWLVELLANGTGGVVVVTRRPGEQTVPGAITYRLPDFSRAEVVEYLRDRLGEHWVDEQTIDAVIAQTHCVPQAVGTFFDDLAGRVRHALGGALKPATEPVGQVVQYVTDTTRTLVAKACQEVTGRDEQDIPLLEFLVVMRHVDGWLLGKVLADRGVTEDQAGELATRLTEYSMITGYDDDEEEGFRLHEGIRQQLRGEIPAEVLRRRHQRVERVYAEFVAEYEPAWQPGTGAAFTVWSRFEAPEFQRMLREWLHHAVRSQGRQLSTATAIRITQIFLEAFWWWGFYLRSPVCEQLLREFELVIGDRDGDRPWLDALSRFYRNYKRGWARDVPGPQDWREVDTALFWLRKRVGLQHSEPMDAAKYTISIISDVFRAHSLAMRTPNRDPDGAATLLDRARATVRESVAAGNDRHAWYEGWILYHTIDLWTRCGRPELAVALLRELDELAAHDVRGDLVDRDLIARAIDAHAEIHLSRQRFAAAIDSCARSALLVYVYHVWQETPDQPPNEYTYERHREVIARASTCLTEVRKHDPAAWQAGIIRMCALFEPYWRLAGGVAAGQFVPVDLPAGLPALPTGIIPPVPDRRSLGQLESPFTRLADQVVAELGPALEGWVPFSDDGPDQHQEVS